MSVTVKDFAVDSTIQSKANKKRKGIVLNNALKGPGQEHLLAVEWSDGSLAKVHVNDVEPSLSIEEEFKIIQNNVNEKIKQAANLISEAASMADSHGYNLLSRHSGHYEHLFEYYKIEDAMDEAGWNTSSWHC